MWEINPETLAIKCTLNDTPTFTVTANVVDADTGEVVPYVPEPEDKIVFAIRKGKKTGAPLVTFDIDNEDMTVTFEEGWGDSLPDGVGKYYYEVSLNRGSYHDTFIASKTLLVLPEIYKGNN